jgi:kynureninase
MISNSLGAMPNRAREMALAYVDKWADRGVRAWEEEWWLLPKSVGNHLASLLHAAPDSITMHTNVTTTQAVILSCFSFGGPRHNVIMVDMEFPSLKYLYREWTEAHGGRLEIVPCPDGVTVPTEQLLDAIDETTLLVPISHVLFRSSYLVDAAAIIKKAHDVGALVVLDIYQSIGSLPVDVEALNVDFAVGGCLKWLCGGPGACFLYVRPDLKVKLRPHYTGWLAHERPFAFEKEPIELSTDSYRFMNGTPPVPSLYLCRPGLDIVTEIGVDRIRRRSEEMTSMIVELARERGWRTTVPEKPEERGGTVAVDVKNGSEVADELNRRDFLVDFRPQAGIRLSPHFYTTDQEIIETIEEIEKILAEKSLRR